ncbi:hypothetical protein M6B22_04415 [Jatrophihabitans cynanchi]|uniref:Polyketide cyclase / dehydrase and lipid transport n=1 Tax=Jatrophihabitans cynanchi TaxID=2944128 RepID=A0ABY7JZK8_9ACTN|nr:hypothetical protein [Jatrophihabitans sp. SB3-54]WAX58016.1 hypothetical protein M6B22_04415 [Jatrophihabitans sp. SB3-54]
MPAIDIVDSTWICTRPATLGAIVAEPANWRQWWPRLDLQVDERRGEKGMRWFVGPSEGGTVAGSMEVWLEPALDGVVAHYFLRLDGTGGRTLRRRAVTGLTRRYRLGAKELFWSLGSQLDPGRISRIAARRSG